ncbi:MAG: DnaJ domain-containing protein [Lachnospiraceae bacterium]
MDMITSYEQACRILGVSLDSTKEEQKNAYRKIAKKYHPDSLRSGDERRNLSSAEQDKMIQFYCLATQAYEYLSNAEKPKLQKILGNTVPSYTKSAYPQDSYHRKQMEAKRKAEKMEQLKRKAQEIHEKEQKAKENELLNQIRWLRIADIIHRVMREDQQKKET